MHLISYIYAHNKLFQNIFKHKIAQIAKVNKNAYAYKIHENK